MNKLKETLSNYWLTIQSNLFPWLQEEVGELGSSKKIIILMDVMAKYEQTIFQVQAIFQIYFQVHSLPSSSI